MLFILLIASVFNLYRDLKKDAEEDTYRTTIFNGKVIPYHIKAGSLKALIEKFAEVVNQHLKKNNIQCTFDLYLSEEQKKKRKEEEYAHEILFFNAFNRTIRYFFHRMPVTNPDPILNALEDPIILFANKIKSIDEKFFKEIPSTLPLLFMYTFNHYFRLHSFCL